MCLLILHLLSADRDLIREVCTAISVVVSRLDVIRVDKYSGGVDAVCSIALQQSRWRFLSIDMTILVVTRPITSLIIPIVTLLVSPVHSNVLSQRPDLLMLFQSVPK